MSKSETKEQEIENIQKRENIKNMRRIWEMQKI
jgi:hypothetical protein